MYCYKENLLLITDISGHSRWIYELLFLVKCPCVSRNFNVNKFSKIIIIAGITT